MTKTFRFVGAALFLVVANVTFAQIKVGDNPETINANALLELETTDKGVLMPRVALTSTASASPLSAHVQGIVVYNTATAGAGATAVSPGFYYNSGTEWLKMLSSADATGDNLGNHTATEDLIMGSNIIDFGEALGEKIDYWGGDYTVEIQASELRTNSGGMYTWRTGGTERVRLTNGGNFGVGLTTVNNKVDIASVTRSGTHATGAPLYVTGNIGASSSGIEFRHTNGTQGVGFGYNTIYASGSSTNQNLNLLPKGTGGVGVGTTSPGSTLDVNGKTRTVNFQLTTGATSGYVLQSDASGNGTWVDAASLSVTGDNLGNHIATTNLNMSNYLVLDANYVRAGLEGTEGSALMRQGTATQTGYFEVRKADNTRLGYIGWDNTNLLYNAEAGANHYFAGGSVGVGTAAPTATLDVEGDGRFENTVFIDDHNNNSPGGPYFSPQLSFRGNAGAVGAIIGFNTGTNAIKITASTATGAVDLVTNAGVGLRLDAAGNVGIGTTGPARKLTVAGANPIRTTGMTSATADQTGTLKQVTVDANGDFGVKSMSPSETGNNVTPNTNGGSGSIPGNATTFACYDGNWVSNVTLPTAATALSNGWKYGEIMVIRRASSFGVSVNTANTDLGSALAIPGATSVGFALGFERWYRVF